MRKVKCSNEFFLTTKFLTNCTLNAVAIIRTFNRLWQVRSAFKVRDACDHVVLFIFDNDTNVERILKKSQPWSFDRHPVVLQRYDNHSPIRELAFD